MPKSPKMTFHQTHRFKNTTQTSSFSNPSTSLLSSTNRNNTSKVQSDQTFDLFNEREDYSETEFLKNSIANHTKYGSTAAIPSTHFQYVTHYVEPFDTLQGLALRYGCKIENIKKCNKLFSDDNNYVRSRFTLLMPIECSKNSVSPLQSSSSSQESNSSLDGNIPLNSPTLPCSFAPLHPLHHSNSRQHQSKLPMKPVVSSNNVHPQASSLSSLSNSSKTSKDTFLKKKQISLCDSNTNSEQNNCEESIADFLIRIDSSIAASKREANKIAKKAQKFDEIKDEFSQYRFNAPKPSSDCEFFAASSGSIFDNTISGSKELRSKSKKAKYRYEKAHDEIFEL